MLKTWWEARGWAPVEPMLQSSFGLMAVCKGAPTAAIWLYLSPGTGLALLEWCVTNPSMPMKARHAGVKCLLEHVKVEAKTFGVSCLFVTLKSRGLIRMYEKAGFITTDTNMTNMICNL